MKLWVDDVRTQPNDDEYVWSKSVNEAIAEILLREDFMRLYHETYRYSQEEAIKRWGIELIDLDHDAGDFAEFGGDYINLLNWLEETGRNYPIRIHSMNPVGIENMRRIIQKNDWKEVKQSKT